MADELDKVHRAILRFALGFPGAHEDHPWGETVTKVGKKVFLFLGSTEGGGIGLGVKLPDSGRAALELPFTEPTHYGLGKHGWVSATFSSGESPPMDLICRWIEESYRAVAPKKLVAELDGELDGGGAAPKRSAAGGRKKRKKK
jgi:predicted DNA-binding protein (MmcQ/YjbR family)